MVSPDPTRRFRRAISIACLLALALSLAMAGCDPSSSELPQRPGFVTYRHAMDGAPTSLDPAHAASIYANFLVVNLYDTLYRYRYLARPYALEPNLAESLPEVSADGLIYTVRIKPGVRFIDDPAFPEGRGRVVRAEDVIYSIKRHFDPATRSQGSWLWSGRIVGLDEWGERGADYDAEVPGLRALDDRTIQIQLVAPYPQLTHTLAQGFAAVVPREAVEHHRSEFGIQPVGSGPFRLQRFDSTGTSLARNEAFRAEPFSLEAEGYDAATQAQFGLEHLEGRVPPFADRIEVSFIAEDAARWNTFIAGEVDFVKVPATQFDQVLAGTDPPRLGPAYADRHHLLANMEAGFVHTDFNMDDPRIGYHPDTDQQARNHALRCAIIKAFDWEQRNRVFYSGLGHVFNGIIPPVTAEFDARAGSAAPPRDLLGAMNLLKGAGWHAGNLPVLEYGFPSSVTERQMFEQFRSFLGEIGYPPDKVRPLTFASYGDYARAFSNREVMLITSAWTMDYPDTQNTMQLFYGPNAAPGANSANYRNEEFDRLYQTGASMPPSPLRTTLYQKMNRLVIDDCVTISGVSRTLLLLWDRGWSMLPDRSFVGGYFFRFAAPAAPPGIRGPGP